MATRCLIGLTCLRCTGTDTAFEVPILGHHDHAPRTTLADPQQPLRKRVRDNDLGPRVFPPSPACLTLLGRVDAGEAWTTPGEILSLPLCDARTQARRDMNHIDGAIRPPESCPTPAVSKRLDLRDVRL